MIAKFFKKLKVVSENSNNLTLIDEKLIIMLHVTQTTRPLQKYQHIFFCDVRVFSANDMNIMLEIVTRIASLFSFYSRCHMYI